MIVGKLWKLWKVALGLYHGLFCQNDHGMNIEYLVKNQKKIYFSKFIKFYKEQCECISKIWRIPTNYRVGFHNNYTNDVSSKEITTIVLFRHQDYYNMKFGNYIRTIYY